MSNKNCSDNSSHPRHAWTEWISTVDKDGKPKQVDIVRQCAGKK